jgi:predicted amidohydrolase YtcJ
MRTIRILVSVMVLIAFFFILNFYLSGIEAIEKADLIMFNGNVITIDTEMPQAEAIAIKEGRILAVGTNKEIEKYKGDDTKTIDLQDKTVLPGLIDAHMHFPLLGLRLKQLYLDNTKSAQEAIDVISKEVAKAQPGEWISGRGWHTVYWNTTEYPDNRGLNKIAPDNPVFLVGMATHAAWVNEKALQIAGITKDTPNPPGGEIVKNPATGEPTGILLEKAMDLVIKHIPSDKYFSTFVEDVKEENIKLSIQTALKLGLTEVHDPGVGYSIIKVYKELLDKGELNLRLYVMFRVPDGGKILDEYIAHPPQIGLGNHKLTLRCIKVFVDGALGARGAAMIEPYSDNPDNKGMIRNDEEQIYQVVSKSMRAGYQVAMHAIGDYGNRIALNGIERALKDVPTENHRMRIEHAQILSLEDIPRFAQLGIVASMQPIHCTMDMGFTELRVGPERVKGAYDWKSLLDSGVIIAGGSDVPAFPVYYSNPLWGIYAAVTRQDNNGNPPGGWHPEQKLSRMDAIKMYTINAAYAAFEEDIKGSLTPGKLADVTVVSKDILSIPEREIVDTEVLMTIVGGKIVYQK